ncbi:hypothetical protein NIIDMKKI_10600 [Mycobacterium kansasii]|uniref:Uncharacterized protein n=1 Tax=Mycobacterium kansasii TaxID=1768 RepID=A0A7G1I5Z5_MYCKA|nr:hypothetical protein NIIDMKKI_10600 [Mycobacterium kansasii]
MCAIAGAFSPNQFDSTICTNAFRLAATAAGTTVAARAASNTPATVRACPAAATAWVAAALSQLAYGAAAATIAVDAGPCHAWAANPEVSEPNDDAAELSSSANPAQAAAASSMGAAPAPANIREELISGGNTE